MWPAPPVLVQSIRRRRSGADVTGRPYASRRTRRTRSRSVRRMGIVDDLLAHPGLYLGIDTAKRVEYKGAARIVVTPLPGSAGVTLDYEILNPAFPDEIRGHVEHTIIGKLHDGRAVMVIGHTHGSSVT